MPRKPMKKPILSILTGEFDAQTDQEKAAQVPFQCECVLALANYRRTKKGGYAPRKTRKPSP